MQWPDRVRWDRLSTYATIFWIKTLSTPQIFKNQRKCETGRGTCFGTACPETGFFLSDNSDITSSDDCITNNKLIFSLLPNIIFEKYFLYNFVYRRPLWLVIISHTCIWEDIYFIVLINYIISLIESMIRFCKDRHPIRHRLLKFSLKNRFFSYLRHLCWFACTSKSSLLVQAWKYGRTFTVIIFKGIMLTCGCQLMIHILSQCESYTSWDWVLTQGNTCTSNGITS